MDQYWNDIALLDLRPAVHHSPSFPCHCDAWNREGCGYILSFRSTQYISVLRPHRTWSLSSNAAAKPAMFHVDSLSVPVVRGGNWIETGRTLFVGCVGPAVDGFIYLAFLDWIWDWDWIFHQDCLPLERSSWKQFFLVHSENKAGLQMLWGWKSLVSISTASKL